MSCVDVGDILLTTVGESSGRAPDLDGPGPPPVDGRTVVADLERSGIPAARCGPQWAGVSALKPVAVAVVPATQPATNPDFGRPGRPGRWMGGSHDGGSPYPLRPRTRPASGGGRPRDRRIWPAREDDSTGRQVGSRSGGPRNRPNYQLAGSG